MTEKLSTEIVNGAIEYALTVTKIHYDNKPMSIAICDAQGFLLAFIRKEHVKLLTIELTQHKAYTSARMGCTTRDFLHRLQKENLEINFFADKKFTALPGGIPLINKHNQCIGAVAVGGISSEGDHQVAEMVATHILNSIKE
ncbi:hypothetical protein A9G13_07885 [Gilliamella sp. wkB178]|uniref:GlcG/HbpS family heme-binding protein n=1 Tax=Gilliamella sp. wkB178 TaxID=3120259 RepID=UPI00080EC544|nr:heme-binding protein [Gilliamella apicola]OCG07153.1 hypothetical protein A9G13_07885 [Gilliamella apicola]